MGAAPTPCPKTSASCSVLGILAMALVGAALEVVGVGLVFPLIALLHEPERIRESEHLMRAYVLLGTTSTRPGRER